MSPVDPPTVPIPTAAPIPTAEPLPAAEPTDPSRRRRRTALTFGLIALPVVGSAFVLPAFANAAPPTPVNAAVVLPGTAKPDTAPTADDTFVQAYLDAGYSFDDAVVLAKQWGLAEDFYQAKVKAGQTLKQGIPLKAGPHADPHAADGYTDDQLTDLFLGSGYSLDDATVLAGKWKVDVGEAKARAGRELKVVGALPFVDPNSSGFSSSAEEAAFSAFFDAGLDYDDAVTLAEFWGLGQPADAKVKAGNLLRNGEQLPAVPGVHS
jgi:hypothetical protein